MELTINMDEDFLVLNSDLKEFELPEPKSELENTSSQKVLNGKSITPKQHLLLLSADEWEEFIEEWGVFKKSEYQLVTGLGGANDFGIDVACFLTEKGFLGEWDNFQCKYYKGDPLAPGTAIPEIGKLLWHIYKNNITAPSTYYFFAPKDCGPSLKKLLLNSEKLKNKVFEEWDNWCATTITKTQTVSLDGEFLKFVSGFDFGIFKYKPVNQVVEEYRDTPYFSTRFGGGLKDRPSPTTPPDDYEVIEARYIDQLHEAYAENKNVAKDKFLFDSFPELEPHFIRQREAFYFAESLRAFARDSVPSGTFEDLQNDMFDGVVDTAEDDHKGGLEKLKSVMKESKSVPLDANGLIHAVRVKDRYGICHQLANDDRLIWVKDDE
jgi:hypothetical protein